MKDETFSISIPGAFECRSEVYKAKKATKYLVKLEPLLKARLSSKLIANGKSIDDICNFEILYYYEILIGFIFDFSYP